MKLSKARRELLERIGRQSGDVLLLNVGGYTGHVRALATLGLIEVVDHPQVVDRRTKTPAAALAITDEGRKAL